MFFVPESRIEAWIEEDLHLMDLTVDALGIEDRPGCVECFPKEDCVIAGVEEAARIFRAVGALAKVSLLCLPAYTALCLYSLGLRIQQYGLSVDRIHAAFLVVVTGIWGLGYAGAVLLRQWPSAIGRINTASALILSVLVVAMNSPLLDPYRLAANNQVDRLLGGQIAPADFDYLYLRFSLGRYGNYALARLKDAKRQAIAEDKPLVAPAAYVSSDRGRRRSSCGVVVKGDPDLLAHLARCCNPVMGDDIVGFITRGRGVSVHRNNCPNVQSLMEHPERMIDVEWDTTGATEFHVEIVVEACDRMGLIEDVSGAICRAGGNILSTASGLTKGEVARMRYLIAISDASLLDPLLALVSNVPSVFDCRRIMAGEGAKTK